MEELCYEAQQCVEKSLKAIFVALGFEPPRIHNIEALFSQLSESVIPPKTLEKSFKLMDYATTLRYPSLDRNATDEDLAEAIEMAEAVFAWTSSVIKDKT